MNSHSFGSCISHYRELPVLRRGTLYSIIPNYSLHSTPHQQQFSSSPLSGHINSSTTTDAAYRFMRAIHLSISTTNKYYYKNRAPSSTCWSGPTTAHKRFSSKMVCSSSVCSAAFLCLKWSLIALLAFVH